MKLNGSFFHIISHKDGTYKITLNKSHVIYRAHFPGNPITPGVCVVKMINELLEERVGKKLRLKHIKNLKFIKPIQPDSQPQVNVNMQMVETEGDEISTRGIIEYEGKTFTKFSLTFVTHE